MSAETEESSGSGYKSDRRKSLDSLKARSKKASRIIISSDDEEENQDFAPQDLRIMGATNVGALGLDCLDRIESMRARSKNLQGGFSGKMRRDLEKAKDVINTLIFKSEASGDPAYLKIKNRELLDEMKKLKMKDTLREREAEQMRLMFEELRKEVSELRDKLDDAEEDRRKARESLRITQGKLRKLQGKETEEDRLDGPGRGDTKYSNKDTMNLPVDEQRPMCVDSNPEDPSVMAPETPNDKPETKEMENNISKQIKELVKKKAELRKRNRTGENETGSDSKLSRENPLPQPKS